MSETILLGAGASVEAGIPETYGLTEKVLNSFHSTSDDAHLLKFLLGGLLFQKGIRGESPIDGKINIESLLNTLQLLSNRYTTEISPFVSSWHPIIDELEKTFDVRPQSEFHPLMRSVTRPNINANEFVAAIKDLFEKYSTRPQNVVIYQRVREKIMERLKKILWIEDVGKVEYFKPLLNLFKKQDGLTVTSLNYDNSIELFSSSNSVECNTQMGNWSKEGRLDFGKNQFNLIKLHGSINWAKYTYPPTSERPIPQGGIVIMSEKEMFDKPYLPQIIFGISNKLTTDGPYLDLLREFQKTLSASSKLTIVGYSFRDEHINHYISQWINSDPENLITIVDPDNSIYQSDYFKKWGSLISGRVIFCKKKASEGLKDLYS